MQLGLQQGTGGTGRAYAQFSISEMEGRWEAFRKLLGEQDLDAGILRSSGAFAREVFYLTDWPGGMEGLLYFPREGDPVLLVQLFNHLPMARRTSRIDDTRWGGVRSAETMATVLREHHGAKGRIGLVGTIPYQHYEHWRSTFPDFEWRNPHSGFQQILAVKSQEELERIQFACELTDRAMEALEEGLRPGLQEWELPAIIERPYLEAGGYTGIHYFAGTAMRDPDLGVPAQYPSNRPISLGDAVITEITGCYWGYSGQIHRTYFIGEPPIAEWRRMHDVAMEVYVAIENTLKDGAVWGDVLDAAELVHERGYSLYDDLLHGLNQLPPVGRSRRSRNQVPEDFRFKENMVVVVQPNVITLDERMGLQFGEAVRITRTGVERLHRYRREAIVCAQ